MWRQARNCACFANHCENAFHIYRIQCRSLGTTRRNVPAKLPLSRKDKIRRIEKILPDASLISKQLMNRAENRITTAHDYVMSFWNAERYQKQPTEDGSPPPRPPRVGPDMNRRWWLWNISFALFPAVFLTFWAELYGKPKMKAAFIKAEVEKRKLIFGPNYVPKEGEIKYPEDNDPILDRLQRAIQDLSMWFLGINIAAKRHELDGSPQAGIPGGEAEKQPLILVMASKQRRSPLADASLAVAQQQVAAEAQPPTTQESSKQPITSTQQPPTGESRQQSTTECQQQPTSEESEGSLAEKGDQKEDWRWNELFSRITNIENRLSQQEQRQQNMHDFQWHRLNQSNIQNRGEDQLIKHWESQRQVREPQNIVEKSTPFWTKEPNQEASSNKGGGSSASDVGESSLYTKWKAAMWTGLRQNLDAKKEAMEKYGVDIMDRAWGFWTDETEKAIDVKPPPHEGLVGEVAANPAEPLQPAERSSGQPSETIQPLAPTPSSAPSLTKLEPATITATNAIPLAPTAGPGSNAIPEKDKVSTEIAASCTDNKSPPVGLWHRLLGRRS